MKIIVTSQEEAVKVARFLVSICNSIRATDMDSVSQMSIEVALMMMRDSIEVREKIDGKL